MLRERERERDRKREGGWREGERWERVYYIEKTSILALFYTFVESFILTILLFVQESNKLLLPIVESSY